MRASVRVSRKSNPSLRYLGHGAHLVIIWYFIYLPIHTTYFSFYFVFGFVYGKWITSELKLRNCGNETINATVKVKASRERKMCVCVTECERSCDWSSKWHQQHLEHEIKINDRIRLFALLWPSLFIFIFFSHFRRIWRIFPVFWWCVFVCMFIACQNILRGFIRKWVCAKSHLLKVHEAASKTRNELEKQKKKNSLKEV